MTDRNDRRGQYLERDNDYCGRIHIDREGFRGPELAARKAPGVLRLMAIGSSTTFDPSVSGDAATWPARLQFLLAQLWAGPPGEEVNGGGSSEPRVGEVNPGGYAT